VERIPVDLQTDGAFDHEVYRAEIPGYPNLLMNTQAESGEPRTGEALRQRVTSFARSVDHSSGTSGYPVSELVGVNDVDVAGSACPVNGSDRVLESLCREHHLKRLSHGDKAGGPIVIV
jgi:hypothetical protein